MDKVINTVYSTTNYEKFKKLDGNRSVTDGRVEKIIRSIETVGFIEAPIICNEKFEVIDGQGRLQACKRKGLPVPYIIIHDLGIEECMSMNIYQVTWTLKDYINSAADRGVKSFVLLRDFLDNSPYNISISIWAIFQNTLRNLTADIKNGTLRVTEASIQNGHEFISFFRRFDDIKTNDQLSLYRALGRCYLMPEVDTERLVQKVHAFPRNFLAISSTSDAIDVIEQAYNNRVRNGKYTYIKTLYMQMLKANLDHKQELDK